MGGELFTLFAKLILDTSEFDKKTEESTEKASIFGDVLKADLVGKGISAAFDGLKKLGSAVKDFAVSAVSSYGDVEQLRGGVKTLFGDSAQKVLADADQAFKTAGMNAADYMETSIQSAASLINSLGGDQAKAADLMNMSITDMADNVNKMGTSMEGVQNAYRGFSRGNFTMLDNLALGFAGTKDGMQQLLEKAEQIKASQGEMVDYSIDSYADMVEAIHVVQTEMGITGTTSKEASGTIQGSLNAMKSAWDNLVAGIADPDADMGELILNMVDSAETALDNVLPAVERTFDGIGEAVTELAPVVVEKIPEIAGEIMTAGKEALTNIMDGIFSVMSEIKIPFPIGDILSGLVEMIQKNVPIVVGAVSGIVSTVGSAISQQLPNLLAYVLPLIESLSETIRTNAGTMVDIGIEFILNLVQGLMDGLPTMLEYIPDIITNLANVINDNAPKLLIAGFKLLVMVGKGLINAIPAFIENIPKIVQAIIAVWSAVNWMDLGRKAIKFIGNGIRALANDAPSVIKSIGNKAYNFFKNINWSELGRNVINKIAIALRNMIATVPGIVLQLGNDAWNKFNGIDWYDLGSNVIQGIVNGLNAGVQWIKDTASSVASRALEAAKNVLGIKSPSRRFRDEVGKMIPRGMALGVSDAEPYVDASMDKLGKRLIMDFEGLSLPTIRPLETIAVEGTKSAENGKIINITNNISVDGAENPEDFANRLVREMELQVRTA